MEATVKPGSEAELAQLVAQAEAPFEIIGTGTKRRLGRPVQAAQTLDMSAFTDIAAYEPEELILEPGPEHGSPRSRRWFQRAASNCLRTAGPVAAAGQRSQRHAGGLMACNLAGPRRIKAGAARDHVLGIRGVSGTRRGLQGGRSRGEERHRL